MRQNRISSLFFNFICPSCRKMRRAVTAFELAGLIKIDFYIRGNDVIPKPLI